MPKCDVLQSILDVVSAPRKDTIQAERDMESIRRLCESAIAEKVELKGQRATDKIPTAYIYFDGDDFIVPSPSGNPDEEYFTDNLADALETYDAMRNIQERAERVLITLREAK